MENQGGNNLLDAEFILKKADIKQGGVVADLGCGSSGHFIYPAAQKVGSKGMVYAVDILKYILKNINTKINQEGIDNIKPIWSDLERFGATDIESESIDTGLLVNTLYQSKNRPAILKESHRLLKTGGKFLIVEWEGVSSPVGPPMEMRVKKDLLKQGCAKIGFYLEEEFSAGTYHFGLLFTKK